MDFKTIDPMTLYVVVGGVVVIFVGLVLRQVESLRKTVPFWLWSGLAGALFGAAITGFAIHKVGASRTAQQQSAVAANVPPSISGPPTGSGSGPNGGMGSSAAMGGGRGSGMGGPGGPGSGGGQAGGGGPRARRDLPALIGKLELLTRGLQLNLDEDQKAKLASAIEGIDSADEMPEEAAKARLDAINEILTADNAELLASIELPRGRAGGATGGRPAPAGQTRSTTAADGGTTPGGQGNQVVTPVGAGSPPLLGGTSQQSDENPFKQQDNAKRLQNLRQRIAGSPSK